MPTQDRPDSGAPAPQPRATRAHLILRRALLEDVVGSPQRLTLIEASAGFGKTTLLDQWCQAERTRGTRVVRITFESRDRDPEQFVATLHQALLAAGIDMKSLPPMS